MGTNETNLHRAARKLQRTEGISYQQARQRVLDERAGRRTAVAAPVTPAVVEPADDGERRCTECGDSFNLEEGGTDLSAETGSDDGHCLYCESAVEPDDAPEHGPRLVVGERLDDLSGANLAGGGTVAEVDVSGNPNLVRVALDGGGSLVIDTRRLTVRVGAAEAFALISAAVTTEAADLEGLVAASREVVAVADPGDGRWVLHCALDADHTNVAFVDPRVTANQLEGWFGSRGVPLSVAAPDGSTEPTLCVEVGMHGLHRDDDGFCDFCGQDDLSELARTVEVRGGRCLVCRVPGHDTCAMVDGCSCCERTRAQLAELSR